MKPRLPILSVGLAAVAIVVHALPATATALQFDRTAIAGGEMWRLLTGHVVHFDANHLLWDGTMMVILGAACERQSHRRTAAALALAATAIDAAVWWLQPQFAIYRGLSGLASALFGLLGGLLLQRGRPVPTIAGALALAGFAAKSAFELATAQTVFASGNGYAPVPLAHLVGLAAGLIAALSRPAQSARSTTMSSACNPQKRRSPAWKISPSALSLATTALRRVPAAVASTRRSVAP